MRRLSGQFPINSMDSLSTSPPQLLLTRPPTPPPSSPNLISSPNSGSSSNGSNSINNNHLNANNNSYVSRRKFSFPIALHSSLLLGEPTPVMSARRRLSNVSDVVTRKLSSTIGWKNAAIPTQEIISQGKCLCGQYIRCRLKRAGYFNRKLGLQRIRSILGTSSISIIREVFLTLNLMGQDLERNHPRVFTNVARQLSRETAGELSSEESAPVLISAIARYLFKSDITWSKVVALFAVTGGLAVDCVRQGHPDYLPKLIEGVGDVIEDELVGWLNDNGGWTGLNSHVKSIAITEFRLCEYIVIFVMCLIGVVVLLYFFKFVGYHVIPWIFYT